LILLDAALLLEAGWKDHCDAVIFLDVPYAERLRRVQSRGWSEAELQRREASQWPLDQKRESSDLVLPQAGSLQAAAQNLAEWLQQRFSQHLSPVPVSSC
jgi:dephospho-CoA kinase